VLSAIGARDHQRSDYLADQLAARIAGGLAIAASPVIRLDRP
jgi:hypothetical protein